MTIKCANTERNGPAWGPQPPNPLPALSREELSQREARVFESLEQNGCSDSENTWGCYSCLTSVCVCHCECIHLLWSLFVNVLCKWMEVIIVSCQCGLSSICLWIASLDGLLAALCCVVSASVTKDKPTCFRYCHTSSTVLQHEILSLPSKFQQISYFWVEFEKFCILSSEVFDLLNQVALTSLSSPSITSVKHLGNHRKCHQCHYIISFNFIQCFLDIVDSACGGFSPPPVL